MGGVSERKRCLCEASHVGVLRRNLTHCRSVNRFCHVQWLQNGPAVEVICIQTATGSCVQTTVWAEPACIRAKFGTLEAFDFDFATCSVLKEGSGHAVLAAYIFSAVAPQGAVGPAYRGQRIAVPACGPEPPFASVCVWSLK